MSTYDGRGQVGGVGRSPRKKARSSINHSILFAQILHQILEKSAECKISYLVFEPSTVHQEVNV
jgi:hypothetical protein